MRKHQDLIIQIVVFLVFFAVGFIGSEIVKSLW